LLTPAIEKIMVSWLIFCAYVCGWQISVIFACVCSPNWQSE